MRIAFLATLTSAIIAVTLAMPAHAEPCVNGQHVGNPHCQPVVAPAPELGTGLLGLCVLAGGLYLALRRRRTPSQ